MHLLKARSKPIQCGRKRKKIPTLGSFAQYKESKSKASLAQAASSAPVLIPPVINQPPKPDPKNLNTYFAGGAGNQKKDASMGHK